MSSKSASTSAVATFLSGGFAPRASVAMGLLVVVLFGAALYLGGAPAIAVPLWASAAALALAFAGVDASAAKRDYALWAAGVIVAVAVIQLVPLPPGMLNRLDPESARLSGGALDPLRGDRRGVARALHLDPGNGYAALQYFVGLVAAYLAAKRVAHRGHGGALLDAAAAAAALIALIALVHKALGVDRVYGVYHPLEAHPPILSPLLNPNHLAAFTGAGAVLFVGRFVEAEDPTPRAANGTGLLLCSAACVMTLSRGGVATALAGVLLFGLLMLVVRPVTAQRTNRRLFATAVAIAVVVSVGLYVAAEELAKRYGMHDTNKVRDALRALGIVRDHPYLGVGAGGLHATIGARRVFSSDYTVERVESLPVDLILAIGPVAGVVALLFGARWLWTIRPSARTGAPRNLAAYSALVVLITHDFVDFALWLGAGGFLAAILGGTLAGECQSRAAPMATKVRPARRLVPIALFCGSIGAGFVTVHSPLFVDRDAMAALAAAPGPFPAAALASAMIRHPGDPYLPLVGASMALRARDPRALRFVNRTLELAPGWYAPHATLARVLAAHGLRSQALVELRSAVSLSDRNHAVMGTLLASLAPSREEIDRAAERSPIGLAFLRYFGSSQASLPLGATVDDVILERVPDDGVVLIRARGRAHDAHDLARELELAERIAAVHPETADAYLGLDEAYTAAGRPRDAEDAVRRGIARAGESGPLLVALATLQAQRRDVAAMRATMNRVFDSTGGDIDARIQNFATLGRLEQGLGNAASALAAYQQADDMALPDHPYAESIAVLAGQLNDLPRVRGACNNLSDRGSVPPALREVCNAATRSSTISPLETPGTVGLASAGALGAPRPGALVSPRADAGAEAAPAAPAARDGGHARERLP